MLLFRGADEHAIRRNASLGFQHQNSSRRNIRSNGNCTVDIKAIISLTVVFLNKSVIGRLPNLFICMNYRHRR